MAKRMFLSYGRQSISEEDWLEVIDVLKGDFLTQGPKVEEFEKKLCSETGARYAVAVSNGTAALHLAALAAGIAPSDEAITSPITFVASANCILYTGATPRFADIKHDTYAMDPLAFEKSITARTKAVIPVDFAGQPADMERIYSIAKPRGITVIEDASHAIGSRYVDGSSVGSCRYSDMTTFSFHPVKTITTGEGGAITTNDKDIYKRLLLLRSHGIAREADLLTANPGPWYYEMQELGFNYRLSDIQAALGISQLKKLASFVKRRREIVQKYNQAFAHSHLLVPPYESEKVFSALHLYVVRINFKKWRKTRKDVMEQLREKGIGTQVHYIPVHLQPYYRKRFGFQPGSFPVSEAFYEEALSLPLFSEMTDEDVDRVVQAVCEVAASQFHT